MVTTEITLEEARLLAEKEIRRQLAVNTALTDYGFSSVRLKREDERTWVFVAGSAEWQDDGAVPGALYARVDKRDGHVWSSAELAASLSSQPERQRRRA
ncbi:MAG: hypothetical protein AAB401_06240 [Acidobacteriota bacterium]